MARKRMIHPGFFTSATLADVDFRCMVTFAGMWIYCDDAGRGEDSPMLIRASIYPRRSDVTLDDISDDLDEMQQRGLLCRYSVGGFALLHLPSFGEHQRVSHPTPSKLPPCPSHECSIFSLWYRDKDQATEKFRTAERARRAAKREQ